MSIKLLNQYLQIKAANLDHSFSSYADHKEAAAYHGCSYKYNGKIYFQRTAKTTPKKIGQFVTCWKRNEHGITTPFKLSDNFDILAILCQKENKSGIFLFTKEILLKKNIISCANNKESGKRGFRVYPIWDKPISKQAMTTQKWQLEYFKTNFYL